MSLELATGMIPRSPSIWAISRSGPATSSAAPSASTAIPGTIAAGRKRQDRARKGVIAVSIGENRLPFAQSLVEIQAGKR